MQRILVIGILGALVLNSGCSSRGSPTPDTSPGANAAAPDQALPTVAGSPGSPAETPAGEKGAKTKQVTIAVSGMT
ncbi:MAG: hypothetical protein L0Y72_25750 [Gemmataceae bacterium]|nr:hypothetical protein [Gemmataceae bacterium]MCI0742452.1 hypothetical protein [Gemmataceae bacterium]